MSRAAGIIFALLLLAVASGCGDVYRPIALPIPLPPPNPAAVHVVAALSANGALDDGSMGRIDVSGDSVASIFRTGIAPVHAAFTANAAKLYVANSGEDTISVSSGSNPTSATSINLLQFCDAGGCAASNPVFVHTTENAKMYVANFGNGTVSVINTNSDVVVNTVAVDPSQPLPNRSVHPVALAETPDGFKLYVVNQGNGTVSSISTVDDTVLKVIGVGPSPVWAVARADNARVYVLDSSGTISVIDTFSDTVISSSASAGAGANYFFYDRVLNRLYVTNPSAGTLSIFDVSSDPPALRGSPIAIPTAASSPCASAPLPSAVTVLGDASRAYVASYQNDAAGICTQVSVIDAAAGVVTNTISLTSQTPVAASAQTGCSSARFRTFVTSSGGGTNTNFKVYVSQCDAGNVAVIDTFPVSNGPDPHGADVVMATIDAPLSTFPGQPLPPPQNPVFLVAGP